MYRINSPKVVSNEIGGEVIIINLDSGLYYSLNQTAGILWASIAQGVNPRELKASLRLANHPFGADEDTVIADFVNKLVLDELLISNETDDTAIISFNPADLAGVVEKPVLDKFEDMQDLLLLDPIHEVAETGWPVKKA